MRLRLYLSTSAVLLMAAATARASVSYSYVTDQTSYTGAVGNTVTVNIYLEETLTNGSTSLIAPNGGLAAAGAGINVSNATSGTSIISGFTGNTAGFGTNLGTYVNQNGGNNLEFSETLSGPTSAGVQLANGNSATSTEVYLGTATITVGTGTTTYTLTSLTDDTINGILGGPGSDTTITKDPILQIDGGGAGFTGADAAAPYTFTVSAAAVPEPSSVILTGLAACALGIGAWRRRRDLAVAETTAV